jgi:hypothetical protein
MLGLKAQQAARLSPCQVKRFALRLLGAVPISKYAALILFGLVVGSGLVHAQDKGALQVEVAGRGSLTGGFDNIRAKGQFATVRVDVSTKTGNAVFSGDGYTLKDAAGHSFSASQDAMKNVNGPDVTVQPGFTRHLSLVFDVPGPGAYTLSGPGISPVQVRW